MRPEEDANENGDRRQQVDERSVRAVPGESRPQSSAIRVRLFEERDRDAVRAFVGIDNGFEPGDTLIVGELNGRLCSVMAVRMMPLVHDFSVKPGAMARRIADAMLHYARGYVRSFSQAPSEALLLVDGQNTTMQRWVLEHGAIEEDPAKLFLLEVR